MLADPVHDWLGALVARHTSTLSRAEFLKAVRALSARYVERRQELPRRSPVDSAGKRARPFAIEVAFEPVPNCFVQQNAWPARPKNDRHDSGRCGGRDQIDQRLIDRLIRVFRQSLVGEIGKVVPATAA